MVTTKQRFITHTAKKRIPNNTTASRVNRGEPKKGAKLSEQPPDVYQNGSKYRLSSRYFNWTKCLNKTPAERLQKNKCPSIDE